MQQCKGCLFITKVIKATVTNLLCRSYGPYIHQNWVQMLEVYVFLTIFSCGKKRKMNEILKNKTASSLGILLFIFPDVDDQIKDTFAY